MSLQNQSTRNFEFTSELLRSVWLQECKAIYPDYVDLLEQISNSYTQLKSLQQLTTKELYQITHAVSTLFQLFNLAEENDRITRSLINNQHHTKLINTLHNNHNIQVRLVFTAHPTEVRRPALLREWNLILQILDKIGTLDISLQDAYKQQLAISIRTLLLTGDVRTNEVTPFHEIRDLWSQMSVLWEAIGILGDRLNSNTQTTNNQIDKVPPIRFGCWVGVDADGNPFVTPQTIQYAAESMRRMALSRYLSECEKHVSHATANIGLTSFPQSMFDWISQLESQLPIQVEQLGKRYREEPFRRALAIICMKLRDTLRLLPPDPSLEGYDIVRVASEQSIECAYTSSVEFLNDLRKLYTFSNECNGIYNQTLARLMFQVSTFGFHYASLEHRIHAKDVTDCYRYIWKNELGQSGDDEIATKIMQISSDPARVDSKLIMQHPVLSRLVTIGEIRRKLGASSIDTVILSGTSRVSDIIGLAYLLQICDVDASCVNPVSVAPLFETLTDLQNAPVILTELFFYPIWKQRLTLQNRRQEVMLGYSDSAKDAGFVAATIALDQATTSILNVCKNNNIEVEFFHGRGGTIARGGGLLMRSIVASPAGVGVGKWKLTEQGEMIAARYGQAMLAEKLFEQLIVATGDALVQTNKNGAQISTIESILIQESSREWQSLVFGTQEFADFFRSCTPGPELAALKIGSRPTKRVVSGGIEALRAIPWNFAWLQNRMNLPGWYGAGSALHAVRFELDKSGGLDSINNFKLLRLLIDKLQLSVWLTDWEAAGEYLKLTDGKYSEFEMKIKQEYQILSEELQILRDPRFEQKLELFHLSLDKRKGALHGLALIQSELLARYRNQPDSMVEVFLQKAILQSVIGVAAGIRNTG